MGAPVTQPLQGVQREGHFLLRLQEVQQAWLQEES
jgi:hypothetical protein